MRLYVGEVPLQHGDQSEVLWHLTEVVTLDTRGYESSTRSYSLVPWVDQNDALISCAVALF